MKNQVCTEEQMIRLKSLGVDTSNASACLLTMRYGDGKEETIVTEPSALYGKSAIPTFTISDLFDKLPSSIIDNGIVYIFQLYKDCNKYVVSYYSFDYDISLFESIGDNSFDAVYEVFLKFIKYGKSV